MDLRRRARTSPACRGWPRRADRASRPDAPSAASCPIRLIALDIDGTLIGDDLVIGDADAGRDPRGDGARRRRLARRPAGWSRARCGSRVELGLTGPVVGYQGALIRAMPERGLRRASASSCVHTPAAGGRSRATSSRGRREHGLDPHVNHLERFILRADDPRADDYSAFMGARAELVPTCSTRSSTRSPRSSRSASRRSRPRWRPRAAAAFAGRADVTISHPRFLEFVAPGVSKGRAVRWLARRLGIPLGATLAVGDQWNDLEMLAEVGHGAAMPTAPAAVRAAARYVAPPLEDEGVAPADRGARAGRAGARPGRASPSGSRTTSGGRSADGVVTARVVADDDAGRAAGRRGAPRRRRRRHADRHGLRARRRPRDARWHRAAVRT